MPPGSTLLVARARTTQPLPTDLDLYLFDCTGQECVASRADGDPTGDEVIIVQKPAAGKWKVVLDASRADAMGVPFEYEDIVFNPTYGQVALTDQPQEHAVSAQWSAKANVWYAGGLPAGRVPYAALLMHATPKGTEPFLVGLHVLQLPAKRASSEPGRR